MPVESSSAASTSGQNTTGGNITVNGSNYVAWIVGGLIVVVLAFVWLKAKGKK